MTSLTYNIPGVGVVPVAVDTTTQAVSNAYLAEIQVFATLYNQRLNNPTQAFTIADYNSAKTAYQTLISLSENGLTVAGQSTPSLINFQMAENLSLLLKTFDVNGLGSLLAGGDAGATDTTKIQALQGWWDLAPAGLSNTINGALTAGASWESIQAMIELQYVQEGNNQISSTLGSLQSALNATDSAVQFLTQLQNLYNDVTPATAATISTNIGAEQFYQIQTSTVTYIALGPATHIVNVTITVYAYTNYTGQTFVKQFISTGDTAFSAPITVTANPSSSDQTTFANMVSTQLPNLITSVMQAAGYVQGDISAVLANPATAVPTLSDAATNSQIDENWTGSLGQELVQVYSDMKSAGDLANYIIDNQTSAPNPTTGVPQVNAKAGDYGRHLSTAEVAAQSINTQQQQQVQQELYVFQEFYQSASGVLTSLTQIIQNMAQAAGQ